MTIDQAMQLLADTLAAAYPRRKVTRSLKEFNEHAKQDLAAGVFTVIYVGTDSYPNYRGREGQLGRVQVAIVGQVEVGEKTEPQAIEAAELAMQAELQGFVAQVLPQGIDSLYLSSVRSSGQLEHPFGWIAAELQMMGD